MSEQEGVFECSECKKQFQGRQCEFEVLPDNFNVGPATKHVEGKGIPKCPHCGYLHFFGFKVVDIAF